MSRKMPGKGPTESNFTSAVLNKTSWNQTVPNSKFKSYTTPNPKHMALALSPRTTPTLSP